MKCLVSSDVISLLWYIHHCNTRFYTQSSVVYFEVGVGGHNFQSFGAVNVGKWP